VFVYKTPDQQGSGPSHAGGGTLEPTGFRPNFARRFEEMGMHLDSRIFGSDKIQFKK